jgi:hypothetical protein
MPYKPVRINPRCPLLRQRLNGNYEYGQFIVSSAFRVSTSQDDLSVNSHSTRQKRFTGIRVQGSDLHRLSGVRQGIDLRLGQDAASKNYSSPRFDLGIQATCVPASIDFRLVTVVTSREFDILFGWICSTPKISASITAVSPHSAARTSHYAPEKCMR